LKNGAATSGDAATMEALRAELEATRDKLLRSQAEFDNYQKRVLRERAEERRYAFLPLLRDLLPVRDNLQRALEAAEKAENQTGLLEGVRLVAQQLKTLFEQYGCREIAAQEAEFDSHLHEALTMQPSEEQPAGRVLSVFRSGYQLHDRVVRPAQVVVSSGPASAKPASE
jgi:molecular chaperone GrpE